GAEALDLIVVRYPFPTGQLYGRTRTELIRALQYERWHRRPCRADHRRRWYILTGLRARSVDIRAGSAVLGPRLDDARGDEGADIASSLFLLRRRRERQQILLQIRLDSVTLLRMQGHKRAGGRARCRSLRRRRAADPRAHQKRLVGGRY